MGSGDDRLRCSASLGFDDEPVRSALPRDIVNAVNVWSSAVKRLPYKHKRRQSQLCCRKSLDDLFFGHIFLRSIVFLNQKLAQLGKGFLFGSFSCIGKWPNLGKLSNNNELNSL